MRPTFHRDLATARVADLHHYAAREQTAKAAIRGRRPQPRQRAGSVPYHTGTGLVRRVLALARGRHPAPTR